MGYGDFPKKILYLMRHGQTLFNVRRKVQGVCDSPLTELGIEQAERACDTLELVTDMHYKRIKGLKEWNFGVFEGESEDLNPKLPYGDFFKAFGGEGEIEVREHMNQTLTEIMEKEDNHTVLAVSHGAACRQFMRYWEHTSSVTPKGRLGNCCILKFKYDNRKFELLEIVNPNP